MDRLDTQGFDLVAQMQAVLDEATKVDRAAIFGSTTGSDEKPRVLTLDLSTAKLPTAPYSLGFPFRSFVVLSATDDNVSINMKISSLDSDSDSFPIKRGGNFKLPFPTSRAYLDWTAQTGKTMTILFFVKGEFSTNALNLVSTGGVSVTSGSSFTRTRVALAAAGAVAIFPLDTTRKKATAKNTTGTRLWIGEVGVTDSTTSATEGMWWDPAETLEWTNTAALYAYNPAATTPSITTIQEF